MTIPFLPTPHTWPFPPVETFWLTALFGLLLVSKLRLPP